MLKNPHWPKTLGYKPIDLGLERVREVLARLGHPERKLPPVVHVAGTNGKGSTIAFLRAMLEAASYKVHVYTSPHLVYFNERIVLAGEVISDDLLTQTLEECKHAAEGIKVTFFEGTTIGALLAFSRVPADIVLLETGMGGRLDATNVIDKPILTVITPISYDHKTYLGDTLTDIAAEKAAIMKPGTSCVVAPQDDEAMAVISTTAKEKNVSLIQAEMLHEKGLSPGLLGAHQMTNAGVAVACAKNLEGFSVNDEHISKGLTHVHWPGRLQQLTYGPLTKWLNENSELWVDGGHNDAAGEALAAQAKRWQSDGKLFYLICGFTQGRDMGTFLKHLAPYVTQLQAVAIPEEITRQTEEEVRQAGELAGIASIAADSVEDAIYAIENLSQSPVRILICGSLYLAGAMLAENG